MTAVPDGGMIEGHAFGEVILVARRGHEVFAIGAKCTHYGASLKNGLLVGDTVRCPWDHACFSLRTGEATDTSCWKVERRNDTFYISGRAEDQKKGTPLVSPESVVIIGAGAAGGAAAEMLRRESYRGPVTTEKSQRSVAIARELRAALNNWKSTSVSSNGWVFPNESGMMPIRKDNTWLRHIKPILEAKGFGWVNFQVLRRSHASMMRGLDVHPKTVADTLGHTLDTSTKFIPSRRLVNVRPRSSCSRSPS